MAGDWVPKLDVSETKDALVVGAEMPGVDPKEMEIALIGDLLTLKGEKEKETVERRSVTTASSGPMARSSAASDCRWRWTEARSPRRSRMVCAS
jgi:HSP20 family molecular chaperone IbpA